jgi:hypothetical protein
MLASHVQQHNMASKPDSLGHKFGQTMHVSQDCNQAECPFACWSSVLHALMKALHSYGHLTESQLGSRDMAESAILQVYCQKQT